MKKIILIVSVVGFLSCRDSKEQIAEYNPEAIEMNNKAGNLLQEFKYDSALILFDEAIEIDNNFYLPHSNKIGIYLQRKQYVKALSESEWVVKKKPDLAEGWFIAGLLNEHQGNNERAMDYYKKSIEIFTERINNPAQEKNLNANKLNRALSKKFIGDESYIGDFNELAKEEELSFIVERFNGMSKQEIMNEFLNNKEITKGAVLFDLKF